MSAFLRQLTAKKTVQQEEVGFRRILGAFDLALLGIGAIVGTGIFVLTGVAAATSSGPAVVISFIIAGIACTFAALSYSELAASVGGCGSAYGYSYAAFGELMAWIIGWDLLLEYGVAVAAVANGWSGYFNNALSAIGLSLPPSLLNGPFAPEPGLVNLPAVMIILILMLLLMAGVRESIRMNAVMVFIKLMTIVVFIAIAMFNVNPDNWSPFVPFGWFSFTESGAPIGILAGASIVFFAYIGFDAISTAVEEAREPRRDVPIGILASLAFCTVIYVIVSGLLTGVVHYSELNVSFPVSFALEQVGVTWASALVATGILTGLTTVMLVMFYAVTRIICAMSRDGLMPPLFGKVHPRTGTPVRSTIICGLIIAVMAGFLPLGKLAELVNIGTLTAFILVCSGVIVLRYTRPDMPRPFKMPWGPLLPALGIVSCAALIMFLPSDTHWRFALWLLAGIAIYFGYGIRHSRLRTGDAPNAP